MTTVVGVHTRVSDLYSYPDDQIKNRRYGDTVHRSATHR
ncbi:MAG: hypothetical protein M3022_12050 [Actinomycetota bacterium]|nr:hypothetical protein [Actinomycetota bacterium]